MGSYMTEKKVVEGKAGFERAQPVLTVREMLELAAKQGERTTQQAPPGASDQEPPPTRP